MNTSSFRSPEDHSPQDQKNNEHAPEALFQRMLEEYEREGNDFLKNHMHLFLNFAKTHKVTFQLSNAFYIDLEKKVVHLDTRWFFDKKCSKEQILWAVLHELTHLRDLMEDEKGVLDTFEYMKKQAKKTGEWYIAQYKKHYPDHPEYVEKLRIVGKDGLSMAAQKMYDEHHVFFNIFDDIFVNTEIPRRAASYEQGGSWGMEPRNLYAEKLFAETDYRGVSRHRQFVYALLRTVMVPDETVVVTQEIQKILETPLLYAGKYYTPSQIVTKFLIPLAKKDTKASTRSMILKQTLEKIYMELLEKDIKEWKPEPPRDDQDKDSQKQKKNNEESSEGGEEQQTKPQESTSKQSQKDKNSSSQKNKAHAPKEGQEQKDGGSEFSSPFEQEQKNFEANSPDQIRPEDFEQLKKKIREEIAAKAAKDAEENQTPEERAKAAEEAQRKAFFTKYQVTPKEYADYQELYKEVSPYVSMLAHLWEDLISKAGKDVVRTTRLRSEGNTLSIPAVIESFPKILSKEFEGLRVMEKEMKEYLPANKPEDIRLRVIGDISGSMDSEKLKMLKKCVVLLLSSFAQFQMKLDMTRASTKTALHVDTEAWLYHSEAIRVKSFDKQHSFQKSQADTMHLLGQITAQGSTANDKVYAEVARAYTEEEKKKIKEGKRMDICIEITDGSPDDPERAKALTSILRESGVITKAFQVGTVSPSVKEDFDEVWNEDPTNPHGFSVGNTLSSIFPALVKLLQKYLQNIQL